MCKNSILLNPFVASFNAFAYGTTSKRLALGHSLLGHSIGPWDVIVLRWPKWSQISANNPATQLFCSWLWDKRTQISCRVNSVNSSMFTKMSSLLEMGFWLTPHKSLFKSFTRQNLRKLVPEKTVALLIHWDVRCKDKCHDGIKRLVPEILACFKVSLVKAEWNISYFKRFGIRMREWSLAFQRASSESDFRGFFLFIWLKGWGWGWNLSAFKAWGSWGLFTESGLNMHFLFVYNPSSRQIIC